MGTEVTCKYDYSVFEVNGLALAVCDTSVIQNLEEDVEDIGVCLFYLVEEHYRVWLTANGFRELAAFLIAYIAGGCTDKS